MKQIEGKLNGLWIHSYEEDTSARIVFRRPDYNFPLSRGRGSITFQKDHVAKSGYPGQGDIPTKISGSWQYKGDRLTISSPGFNGEYNIVEVTQHKLVIEKVEANKSR